MKGELGVFKRNTAVDIVRVIATALVILAHVTIPNWLSLARSFDVCCLVLLSGISYAYSHKDMPYGKYVWKRVKRLCVPAYVTATIIFLICLPLCLAMGRAYPYSFRQIAETYLFLGGKTGGIGYFWIVRIYLLVAIIAPFLCKINKAIKNNFLFLSIVLVILLGNTLVYYLCWGENKFVDLLLENYVMSLLAYASVYMVGIRIVQEKDFAVLAFIVFAAGTVVTQICISVCGGKYIVSAYKYPPQLAYIFFGLALSLLLWLLVDKFATNREGNKVILWLSRESFNIYLAHVVILSFLSWGDKYVQKVPLMNQWAVRYFVILIGSISIIYILDKIIKKIKVK